MKDLWFIKARAWVLDRTRVTKYPRRNGRTRRGYDHGVFMALDAETLTPVTTNPFI